MTEAEMWQAVQAEQAHTPETPYWNGSFRDFNDASRYMREVLKKALAGGYTVRVAELSASGETDDEWWSVFVRVFPLYAGSEH